MNKKTVLVTGVGGYGGQIIKALRLSVYQYKIIGVDISSLNGAMMDVDQSYIISAAKENSYIDEILWICDTNSVSAIFPGTEIELQELSRHRKLFEEKNIFLPVCTQEVIEICLDKWKTIEWLRNNGYKYPRALKINKKNDLKDCKDYPLVLKPSIGGSGSANIYLAQNEEELIMFGEYLLKTYGPFIAQEYIGSVDSEYTVGVLCDMEGNLINSIAVKRNIISGLSCKIKVKNNTDKNFLGSILAISSGVTQGEIGQFLEVTKPCEELAINLGVRGAINIQCRLVDKDIYVFEINPRFSGTTFFRAMVGYNEPDILMKKYVMNEIIEKNFSYGTGYIVRDLREKLLTEKEVVVVKNML